LYPLKRRCPVIRIVLVVEWRPCQSPPVGNVKFHRLAASALLAFGLCGCLSLDPGLEDPRTGPFSPEEVEAFYGRAQDPRTFWLTIYENQQGPTFRGSHRLHAGQFTELPFKTPKKTSSVPVVSVETFRLSRIFALVDTSSANNWMSIQEASRSTVTPLSPPAFRTRAEHVNDPVDGYLGHIDNLKLKTLRIESVLAFVRGSWDGLEVVERGVEKPVPGMVLGMQFLKPFAFVQFDFESRAVRFSADQGYRPDKKILLASVPFRSGSGPLQVAGTINGKPQEIILDTAGSFDVVLPSKTEGILRHLSIGDLVLRDLTISPDATVQGTFSQPRVGLGILSQFLMTLDSKNKVVHFERSTPP